MVTKTKRQGAGALQDAIAKPRAAGGLSEPSGLPVRFVTLIYAYLRLSIGGAKNGAGQSPKCVLYPPCSGKFRLIRLIPPFLVGICGTKSGLRFGPVFASLFKAIGGSAQAYSRISKTVLKANQAYSSLIKANQGYFEIFKRILHIPGPRKLLARSPHHV
jgi:hypothetical protein